MLFSTRVVQLYLFSQSFSLFKREISSSKKSIDFNFTRKITLCILYFKKGLHKALY